MQSKLWNRTVTVCANSLSPNWPIHLLPTHLCAVLLINHWLTDWLIDCLIDWLTDWTIDWLIHCWIDWPIDITFWLICWLVDWLTNRLTEWFIAGLTDRLTSPFDWFADWLTGWLIDWLTDWPTGCPHLYWPDGREWVAWALSRGTWSWSAPQCPPASNGNRQHVDSTRLKRWRTTTPNNGAQKPPVAHTNKQLLCLDLETKGEIFLQSATLMS